MYNILRKLRVFLVFLLLFSVVLINEGNITAFAATTLAVNQTVDGNKVTFKVTDSTKSNDQVSILVVQKNNNSITYMDQAPLQNGEYTFQILLPKGEYTGYISSSTSDKVTVDGIVVANEEKIVSLKSLNPISVQKGATLILPTTVIAVFDSGANREVSVQWSEVPGTDTCGQYTATGKVNGTEETVSLVINITESIPEKDTTAPAAPANIIAEAVSSSEIDLSWTASTDNVGVTGYKIFRNDAEIGNSTTTTYHDTGLSENTEFSYTVKAYDAAGNLSAASSTAKGTTQSESHGKSSAPAPADNEPTVSGNKVNVIPKLDANTAKAEINADTLKKALDNSSANAKGIKKAEINVAKVEGAKNYEATLPVTAVAQETKTQEVHISTPLGSIEVPSDMLTSAQSAGTSKVSICIENVDKASITDQKLKTAIGDRPVVDLSMKLDGKAVNWSNEKSPVKISIPYTPTATELANPEHIIVWYIDGNGKATKVTNAKYDAATGTVTFKTTHFSKYAVAFEMKTFADIGSCQWAQKQIEVLASKGVISGTSETTFSPAENITRADFLVLLVKTLGLTSEFENNFSDVNKGDYYYEALGIAKKLGISTGEGNNQFNPKAQISRQDMMVLCARALKLSEVIKTQGSAADIQKFSDKADVAAYAVDSIASMVKEGIVTGDGSTLNPLGNATRAETAVIMYRIFGKL